MPIPARKIIVAVDDQDDDIDLIRILLRKAGVPGPIEFYRQGEEFIDALTTVIKKSAEAMLPLLCFLDVKMPRLTGHDLLRWMRGQRELDPVSVVMLSSSEHPKDIREAAEHGAQCYLAKYPQPAVFKRVFEEAEQIANSGADAAKEWFGIPSNLLLQARQA